MAREAQVRILARALHPPKGWSKGDETMNIFVEIRAAEGGDDAKLLVEEHFRVYDRMMDREHL